MNHSDKQDIQKVTIKMIAEQAGTSIGTVDRALSGRTGISQTTKDRVLQVAKELGYSPNKFASALSRKKLLRIVSINASSPTDFYCHMTQGIMDAAKSIADYGIEVDHHSVETLEDKIRLLETLNFSEYDGLVINPGGDSVWQYLTDLTAGGLPVVTINTDAPDSGRLFFVGGDLRQSGRLGGELMGKLLNRKGKVAIISNFMQTTYFVDRFGGFCEVMQNDYPEISLIVCSESQSAEKTKDIIIDTIKANPDIGGIFSTAYASTAGAVMALEELKMKHIPMIGYDISSSTIHAIKNGWCSAILYQDPYEQGFQAIRLLARHLLDGWLPKERQLLIESKLVLRYNVDHYINPKKKQNPFLY